MFGNLKGYPPGWMGPQASRAPSILGCGMTVTHLHRNWQFIETAKESQKVGFSSVGWLPAQVPGHVHLDLMDQGFLADPYFRMQEMSAQWVDETDWSYRTVFKADPKHRKQVLRFEGLDTVCTITLNGEKVAEHDNMFVPLELDVTGRLQAENELRVDFLSAARVGRDRKKAYTAQTGEDAQRLVERSFVRKAQCMYGWDWGPRLVSCGIWKPVQLLDYDHRIRDVHVRQTHHQDGRVTLHLMSEIEGGATPRFLLVSPNGETFSRDGDGDIEILDPCLWQPLGFGEPKQYDLFVEAGDDAVTLKIGLVVTKLIEEKDEQGSSFEFEVNGQRVWIRGANWIPDDCFPSRITRERLEERISQAADLGCNMLRVWGGGLYESNDFYELCSEYGILVWQDFAFACAYYPDDPAAQAAMEKEAEANIRRLRNFPCLAIWCGNNENETMWHSKWGGLENSPSRYLGERIYNDTLPKMVARFDPDRPYIPSSPTRGEHANSENEGDVHNWDVWHGRGDWRYYADSRARFVSEYGFASACSLEMFEQVLEEEDWDPQSPAVRWHDKTGKTWEVFSGFVKLHYPDPKTLEDWVFFSQLNQRDALRFALEHYRRGEFCKGSLIWQINDCWPVQSWALLEYDGRYKIAAHELRRLHAHVLAALHRKNEKIEVWMANDGPVSETRTVFVEARNLITGELLKEWEPATVELSPGRRLLAREIDVSGLNSSETLLLVDTGEDEEGTWRLLVDPKDARFAEPAPIQVSTADGGELHVTVSAPVVDLVLSADEPDVFFGDNGLTLIPGDLGVVPVSRIPKRIYGRSLSGEHRVVTTRSPL
jgi:beta-mannosidase